MKHILLLLGLWCLQLLVFGCGSSISQEERQKRADIQYKLGIAEFNRGSLPDALAAFQKALEHSPDAKTHNALGLIYLEQGSYQKAITYFKKALQLDPNFLDPYNNLGTTYARLGDWDKAIAEYQKVINDPLYRTPELAHYNLGLALMEKGDNINAVKQFHNAIQRRPNFVQALDKYGIALYRMNRNQEAIKRFKQAIELVPDFIESYLNLGMVYMKLGQTAEAISQFKYVLEHSKQSNLSADAARYLEMLE
ncbi:hypothetical protein CSA56_01695 [candidate division KSB3 bacterium]|uniref:Uncharacterized protein n=1 Tax=candidate division KSB3 bacterium TaxID=2044937 RepID=A0A2G6KK17_9BACT|nr:MAG: hypothetical protein CSA56_01695 [candidate division KSB3 bacterium]